MVWIAILVNKKYLSIKKRFLNYLNKSGIDTRPIISGNFLNQPAVKLYNINQNKRKFKNAQEIEDRGFFIGLHTEKISEKKLSYLTNKLLKISTKF